MSGYTKAGLIFVSLSLFFFAGILLFISNQQYQQSELLIPVGSTLADIPIGNMNVEQASARVTEAYNTAVELDCQGNRILVAPTQLGFRLNQDAIQNQLKQKLQAAYSGRSFIQSLFSEYHASAFNCEIDYTIDLNILRDYINNELKPRYDTPSVAMQPATDGSGFIAGHTGKAINIDASIPAIEAALCATQTRQASLEFDDLPQPQPAFANLEILLKHIIDQYQDHGQLTEVVVIDPRSDESFNIARMDRNDIIPEVSFTAASTMKVPIMIASYARMDEEPSALTKEMLSLMITESKNEQTDWMMENIIGSTLAPFTVTNDMQALGLKNTFLAGYFYLGAPLLDFVDTPANTRKDIDLQPDVYNQTTAADMANLMNALYHCGQDSSGLLRQTYAEKITQSECIEMIDLLKGNHLPYLISAGIPDGTPIAHKHGWIEEADGLLHTMSNIAIVYSPNADYVLSIFTHHPENLIFDEGNLLFSRISTAVYSYFNPENE